MKVLRDVSLFRYLNEIQLKIIYNMCTKQAFQAGHILFREHDPGDIFYVVIRGSIKIYTTHASGQEKILTVFKAGDSFGELSLIDQGTRSTSAQILEETELYCLHRDHFMSLLKANFDITQGILVELCNRLRDTNRHVQDLTFLDERSRIVKSIVQMATTNGKRDGHLIYFTVPLNNDELAQLAGVKKDKLLQVLQDFQQRAILTYSHDQFILDLSRIQ